MEIRRFFGEVQGNDAIIEGGEHNHLVKVLRYKVGFKVIVCNNSHYEYFGEIKSINPDNTVVGIIYKTGNESELRFDLTLFVAAIKNLDITICKAVELGVQEIFVFNCQNVNHEADIEKMQQIAIGAAKQCGASKYPRIVGLSDFNTVVEKFKDYDVAVLGHEKEVIRTFKNVADPIKNAQRVALIIGPEGGFCNDEIVLATKNGARIISFGKRILRAETAAITALSNIVLLKNI
jgi:16S rRNA (uracil1498-N3)-methyltransferase